MVILPRLITQLSVPEARAALREAYAVVTGTAPSDNILALLMAQSSLETDWWKAMQHYNFGMVKGSESYPSNFLLRDDCGENDCLFRAYADAASGAEDYIRILKARPHWWNGLLTGTAEGFNQGLITPPRYYTSSNVKGYENTLRVRSLQFGGDGTSSAPAGEGGGLAIPLFMLAAGAGLYVATRRKRR